MVKTRFAPSPTGYIHFGNVRTALFCALYARGRQGVFLLRIEDTDQERSREDYTAALCEDLRWLGLHWQEGEAVGGPHGPYRQSERTAVYEAYLQQLVNAGLAYPCFCSAKELEISRRMAESAGKPPRYSGKCAHHTPAEAEAKAAAGQPYTMRFRMPRGTTITFEDLVRGAQKFPADDIGDFIIRRSDGSFAFFFTNAIDDALMGVTHVLRGEDHLTNTPRQLALLEALSLPLPVYGHISLIVDSAGKPLSKRTGSMSVRELREKGYFPLAVTNYLARLGHHYESNAFLSFADLAAGFAAGHLGRAPARYDKGQLDYWQAQAVQHADIAEVAAWLAPHLGARVDEAQLLPFAAAVRNNVTFPADAELWARILFEDELALSPEAAAVLQEVPAAFFATAADLVDETLDYPRLAQRLKEATGRAGKALFLPLRAALTGQTFGPEMPGLLPLIGVARARQRLLQQAGRESA